MPVVSFQAILDKALVDYHKQIGIELDKHPFAEELRGRDSPDDVLKLLESKANAFKVYRDGNRKLIDWLSPVVQVAHLLSGVLGEALPFKPAKAIFVGVDVLITAADGVSSSYDALVDLFECIGNFLKRLRIYTDVPLTPSMTDIIGEIMVELLSVFALATKQIKQGRFKKFAKKLLGESEIEAVLQRLDRLTQEEGRMTVAQTLEVVHGLVNNVKVVMNDGKASTDGIRNALDAMQQMASDINKIRRDQLQKDSRNWLCPPDPSRNYNIGCEIHRDGTAKWFFRESVFADWNAKGSLLWIYGKPGSGKTILQSSIIQEIEGMRKAGLASMAYYYFDFREAEKRNRRGLLSSLVFQLSAESDPCYQILSHFYSDHAGGAREPSEDALSGCLVEMLKVPGQPAMYIIIDALDECPNLSGMPTAREHVLRFLEYLVKLKLPNLHICVSSRLESDIRTILEPLAPFRMSLHDEGGQKADISSYIDAIVHSDQRLRQWREEDKQLVIDTLSDKADGMFRWVFCQLEMLRRTLPAEIRIAVDDIPKTLDETYERALLAIDEEKRQYAQRLFQCLAVSIRPLRVEELAEILAVRFNVGAQPKFNPDWRLGDAEEAVLSVCSNLISIVDVGGSHVVQFSHFSVKEFLTSDRLATAREGLSGYHIDPNAANAILAQASLSVLLQLDDHIDKDNIKAFPLSCYAAQHWVDHGRFENVSSTIQGAMESLFNPDKPHFSAWVWLYDIDDPWRGEMPTTHPERPQAAPLYYAVLCGFRNLIEHLIITHPRDPDTSGVYYESPLIPAFIKEDIDTALLLLRRGADVNVLDKRDMSPLHRASQGGRNDIVRFLLEHNAEVNLRNTMGTTPLLLASLAGEMGVSRLLLQRGANVNSQNDEGFSPLYGAVQRGHLDVVRLLIESGADIDSQTKMGWSPLHAASHSGHVKFAELLIQHGAVVGSRNNDGWTPLHLALHLEHVKVAELLIHHRADVRSHKDDGLTPLHLASQSGQDKIAELLIQRGADVKSRDTNGRTPLHLASGRGHVKVVELLVRHGADVGSLRDDGRTPLHLATLSGYVETAELLIQHGADVGSRNNSPRGGRTYPLHLASQMGRVKVAQLLIQYGADVDSCDTDGRTPLHLAALFGHVKLAELLIFHGADVGSRRKSGRTALHFAASEGHLDFVMLLLKSGADRNVCDHDDKTPFNLASDNKKLEVAKFLSRRTISRGQAGNPIAASINPQNQHPDVVPPPRPHGEDVESSNKERPSVITASKNGQVDILRSLLEHSSDVDVDERDGRRQTALAVASRNGNLQLAKLLIERGADVNSRDVNGWTPLHRASQYGHLHIAHLLLDQNADLNARQRDQRTALHLASRHGHLEIAELLLERGANANVRNGYGWTPRQEALALGFGGVVELL